MQWKLPLRKPRPPIVAALALYFAGCAYSPQGTSETCWPAPDPACNSLATALLYTHRYDAPRLKHLIVGRTVPEVYRMDPDGSNQVILNGSLTSQSFLDVDSRDGRIYLSSGVSTAIFRMDADGSNLVTLFNAPANTDGLDVDEDGNFIYFAANNILYRTDLDGSNTASLVNFGLSIGGIRVDRAAGHIYLAVTGGNAIYRVDLDGTNMTQILTPASGAPSDLALDDPAMGRLFWSNNTAGLISRANVDGGDVTDLVSIGSPQRIAYEPFSGSLYFVAGTELYRVRDSESPTAIATASFWADIDFVYE